MPHLLIIDETGYLPIARAGANLFFQLISRWPYSEALYNHCTE